MARGVRQVEITYFSKEYFLQNVVIFGGSGFIGTFFARHLIEFHGTKRSTFSIMSQLMPRSLSSTKKMVEASQNIEIVEGDVRERIDWEPNESVDLVANPCGCSP